MKQYAKLIDISKCVGCRACEVACKEWNETGIDDGRDRPFGYQSHHDLTYRTWNIVKFYEFSLDKPAQAPIYKLARKSHNQGLSDKLSNQPESQPPDSATAAAIVEQYNLLLGPEPEFNPSLPLLSEVLPATNSVNSLINQELVNDQELVDDKAPGNQAAKIWANAEVSAMEAEEDANAESSVGTEELAASEPETLRYSVWQVTKFLAQDSALSVTERASLPRWMFRKHGCMHCTQAACVAACPVDALQRNEAMGYVRLNVDTCTGCGYCVDACPFGVPQLDAGAEFGLGKVSKCRLCSDRMQHAMQPACVQSCPPNALEFGEREAMVTLGRARVADLTARGYQEAYLYGETELGGLNVLTVLPSHPRDFDLPENPQMPSYLPVWKKIVQPLGALAIVGTALALGFSFFNSRRQKGSGHGSH